MAAAVEPVGIVFAISSYAFCPISIGALGVDTRDPVDTTTLENTEWETQAPPTLKIASNFTLTCLYSPLEWDDLTDLVGVNSVMTFDVPSWGTLTFYGYLKNFIPNEVGKGEKMTQTSEIVLTNTHPTTGAETGPVFVAS